ncbi:unnamed protein product [Musa textilis]
MNQKPIARSAARSLWQSSIGTANSKTCRPYDAKRCTTTHNVSSNTRHQACSCFALNPD